MRRAFTFKNRIKLCVSVLLALNLISIISQPTTVTSGQLQQWPAESLYEQALSWEIVKDDPIHAAIFMFAYVQRNPPEYVNNYQGRKDFVDQKLDGYLFVTNKAILLLKEKKLGPYSCPDLENQGGGCAIWAVPIPVSEVFPPDAVLVCTEPGYRGTCKILFVGNYRDHQSLGVPNNSIASVKVGSRVKITLYADALGKPPMITLAQSDRDLSDNPTSYKFSWHKQVSAAKIEWK